MRVIVLVKATKESEAGEMPSTELMEAMTAFNGYAQTGDNADLKAFAAEVAPKLKVHADLVTGLDRGTKADDEAGAKK